VSADRSYVFVGGPYDGTRRPVPNHLTTVQAIEREPLPQNVVLLASAIEAQTTAKRFLYTERTINFGDGKPVTFFAESELSDRAAVERLLLDHVRKVPT
jgi:hypothetical protein